MVISKIRKRQAQGKASDVYLNGRKLDPERVRREIRRYSKDCNDANLAENGSSIDLGVDSPNRHRIEIRTPASPKIDAPLQGRLDVSHRLISNLEARPSQDVDPLAESTDVGLLPIPEFDVDFMDIDFNTPRMSAKSPRYNIPDFPPSSLVSLPLSLPLGATRASTAKTLLPYRSQPSLPVRNRTSSAPHNSTTLVSSLAQCNPHSWQNSPLIFFWDLPDISSYIPVAGNISTLILENEVQVVNLGQKYNRVPGKTKGWLFSHLVGVDRKLEALQPVADFVEVLVRNPLMAVTDTQVLFNSASQDWLFQTFATVAYLASNNSLGRLQMTNFLTWVSTMGFYGQLSRFLQMESANMYAFKASLLRASVDCGPPNRLFDGSEPLRLLLSLDPRMCSGRLGGELLHEIAISNRTDEALLLLFHGADIDFVQNLRFSGYNSGTPLCRAILTNAHGMIKCLISAGCDVNKRFRAVNPESEETALTIALRKRDSRMVTDLLDAGANVDSDLRIEGYSIVEFVKMRSPRMYKLLQEKLGPGGIPEVIQLIQEAEKGNRPLSKFLLKHNILHDELLEEALWQAVKLGSLGAVRTLLQRGIDPDIRRSRLINGTIEDTPLILLAVHAVADIFYLLVKAGAKIDEDLLMRICRSAIDEEDINILYILAEAGYNAACFGPSVLEYSANECAIYPSAFFLDVGAPINAYGMKGRSCLQVAAGAGHLPLVQYLIDRGADVNLPASNDGGLTALQGAARGGYTEVVEYLIDAGADIRAAPARNRGVTVLEAAAASEFHGEDWLLEEKEREAISYFKSLLALGAPINRTDGTGCTVLHGLLRRSSTECVKLALRAGAQIEDREPSRPMSTPLQVAVAKGEMEPIQLLLEHGADVNAPAGADFGRTALQAATSAEEPNPDLVDLLLVYGADINAPPATRGGVTALQGAAIRGDIQIARILLSHEANVNAAPAPEEGRTAVEGAAEHGRLDMVRLLLSVGAKADPVLGFLRAIELAEKNRHLALADLLREYEIATSLCDRMMESPAQPWLTPGMVFDEDLGLST